MNEPHEAAPQQSAADRLTGRDPLDPALLDLLVDGELSPAEERALLLRLEAAPEGWRHCALAFLEAQAWKRAMRVETGGAAATALAPQPASDLGGGPGSAPTPLRLATADSMSAADSLPAADPLAAAPADRRAADDAARPVGRWLALAAGVLLAFGIGSAVGPRVIDGALGWLSPVGAGGPGLSQIAETTQPGAPGTRPLDPGIIATVENKPLSYYEMEFGKPSGDGEPVRVPVVEMPGIDETWLTEHAAELDPEFRAAIDRYGDVLSHERQLIPVRLKDGRTVWMPLQQIRLRIADQYQ